jgi:4-amino-4-deoxy-L-arabinose transferase-like glycosyltransferase
VLATDKTPRNVLILTWLAVILLLAVGLGVRLYDYTDEPLDFHPTRQLRGAILARSLYYQSLPDVDPALRDQAVRLASVAGRYEPPILETLVAYTYRLAGGEHVWIARIYSLSAWIIGGIALFVLAASLTSPVAALVCLAYYLLLPFGVEASRSFQPDPAMVMWLTLSFTALYFWSSHRSWKWAILAGVFGGMAILTKATALYILAVLALVLIIDTLGFWKAIKNLQVWSIAALMLTPSITFYLLQNQARASEYFSSWTLALSHLLLQPAVYARWFNLVQSLVGLVPLLLALTGVLIASRRVKVLLLGLWGGYFIYGLTVPYQMYTHTYYHLPLIPILALSLAPVAQVILKELHGQSWFWKALFSAIAIAGILFPASLSILQFRNDDYRHEPAYWYKIGQLLPTDGKILALTQDYGYRINFYGWRKVILWRPVGEQELAEMRGEGKEFEEAFSNKIAGADYFLITAFNQLEKQPELQETLYNNYPTIADEKGYLIFDLTHPLTP